ncbi:hypothetical protein OUZ56_020403 [Daphnia magna]|uniref:Uncharacterized protein n=1 Tax=Daphnia magna TaxID=35525 RepID=A0ABQ9ZFW5_9CRUS|nr:hypothetical protein OUZ56_020403 [Daphnia magna]
MVATQLCINFHNEAPGSCGVQLQPIATLVENIPIVSPVVELFMETFTVVISCLQLRPGPPQFPATHSPEQMISLMSKAVSRCLPSSTSSSVMETMRGWQSSSSSSACHTS